MSTNVRELAPLPPLGEVLELLRLVWSVDHELQRTSKRMEVRLGVTAPQRFVLRLVGRYPGMTAGQLAEVLHVNPSTVTGLLKRLASRGLVSRRHDPRDRRRTFVGLTDAGRSINRDAAGTVEGAVEHVIATLPRAKVAAARDVLTALAAALVSGVLFSGADLTRRRAPRETARTPRPAGLLRRER